jgi:hypothetical protein
MELWNDGIVGKEKNGQMERWSIGEKDKNEKKMGCWFDYFLPNIPLFQHSTIPSLILGAGLEYPMESQGC